MIGTLAWSLLVIGLWINVRTLPARIVAAVGVIGLALTPAVYTWDFAILSEALSVGLGVMALGLFAIWTRTGSRVAAAALGVVGVWWTFTRPGVLPYIVVLAVVVLGSAVRRQDRRLTAILVTGGYCAGSWGCSCSPSRRCWRRGRSDGEPGSPWSARRWSWPVVPARSSGASTRLENTVASVFRRPF